MRLTNRCRDLLRLLRAARWLTTSQIHRRFFPTASLAAARKRLRTLERSKYIARYRPHWMAESLLTLGTDGKRMLEKHEGLTIAMQRRPPKQLEHCLGINDLRIAAEKLPDLEYFFACWELADLNWRHRIVPDALMRIGGRTYALEFDRGQEGLRFFLKTKVEVYRSGLAGFPLSAVLVVADSEARMKSLIKICTSSLSPRMLCSTADLIRNNGFLAPVFYGREEGGICL